MMPPGGRQADLPPMHGSLGPALFRSTPAGEGPVPDAHERNAMIGHTLSAVDALLVALRSAPSCLPHHCPACIQGLCRELTCNRILFLYGSRSGPMLTLLGKSWMLSSVHPTLSRRQWPVRQLSMHRHEHTKHSPLGSTCRYIIYGGVLLSCITGKRLVVTEAGCRRKAGVEYSLTLVTREREMHVLGSAGTRWRPSSEQAASPYHSVDVS